MTKRHQAGILQGHSSPSLPLLGHRLPPRLLCWATGLEHRDFVNKSLTHNSLNSDPKTKVNFSTSALSATAPELLGRTQLFRSRITVFFLFKEILLYYFWIHSHWGKTNAMCHKSPSQGPWGPASSSNRIHGHFLPQGKLWGSQSG